MIFNAVCMQVFLNFPRIMAEQGATAGWLLVLYNSVIVLFLFFIITKLFSRFEGKDIVDIGEQIGGTAVRIIVGSIIIIHIAIINSLILREFGEAIKEVVLNNSPINFVLLLFLVGMIAGAYFGVESILRFHILLVPLIIIGLVIIFAGVIPYYDLENLYPLMGSGTDEIFLRGINGISTFSTLIFLFLITPFIKTHKNFKFVGFTAIGMAAFFLTAVTVIYAMITPFPSSRETFLPVYQMTRLIDVPRIFERIESNFVFISVASILLYLSTGFYFAVYVFKKTFKLEYYRPLVIPFALLIFGLSTLHGNNYIVNSFDTRYFRNFGWIVTFVMTILILGIANITKNKKLKGTEKNG